MPLAALHEVLVAKPWQAGAALGFAALLLARAEAAWPGRSLLWIAPGLDAHPPGLHRFGLPAAALVLVRATRPADALGPPRRRCAARPSPPPWCARPQPRPHRRAALAARGRDGGGSGLLLRLDDAAPGPTAALTPWRLAQRAIARGPHELGEPVWELALLRP